MIEAASPPRDERASGRPDGFAVAVGLFLVVALAAGGSSASPLSAGVVRLCGVPILFWSVWRLARGPIPPGAAWPLWLLGAAVALVLSQLIPLPPDVWRALPGRRTAADGFAAAGMALPWLPISLTPRVTLDAALDLIAPAAMFLAVLSLRSRARRALAVIVLVLAAASVTLGMLQLAQGPGSALRFYEDTNPESAVGLFANRNHQAAFLACTLPLAAYLATRWASHGGPRAVFWGAVAGGFALIMTVGAGVTGSRAGAVLIVLGCLGAVAVAARARLAGSQANWAPIAALAIAVLVAGTLIAASGDSALAGRLRTAAGSDLRFTLNPIVARAGWTFAPLGSGVGSFVDVYPMFEPRLSVGTSFVNHAHNDFLEVWLECGWPGVALIAGFLVWWARSLARFGRERDAALSLAGAILVGMLLVHSTVDYPLRTPALATLFALACAWMLRPPSRRAGTPASAHKD